MKYAIVETGSKQYRVEENDVFEVERLSEKEGSDISIKDVLMIHDGRKLEVGQPKVQGAAVVCHIVKHFRGPKIAVFKIRRKKNSRRKTGHRQDLTRLKVKEIKLS